MSSYSLNQLMKDVQKKPVLLGEVVQFIQFLGSAFCERQAVNKDEKEFADIVLQVWEKKALGETELAYVIHQIFPYLAAKEAFVFMPHLAQISPLKIENSLRILQKIFERTLPRTKPEKAPAAKKSSAPSEEKDTYDETILATPKPREEDETLVSSQKKGKGEEYPDDETLVASGPGKEKKGVERNLLVALEQKEEAETILGSKPKVSIIRRIASRITSGQAQTILSTASSFADSEVEALRTQTLVSFHRGTPKMEISLPKESPLWQAKPSDFLKVLHALLDRESLGGQTRTALTQLKNAVIMRTRLLLEESIIINIINEGYRSFSHTLDRLAALTSDKKINRKIWDYLYSETETKLLEHGDLFRKTLLALSSCDALFSLLQRYTFHSKSILKKYPTLKIIPQVKQIVENYERHPDSLVRILNQVLGAYGEVNIKEKLSRLLLTSEADAKIATEILRLHSIMDLTQKLEKLQMHPTLKANASKLLTLVRTYMDPKERLGFGQFATSLNMFAPALSQKVLSIVRQSIAKELRSEMQQLLASGDSPLTRLLSLQKILKNTRYEDPSLTLYGYSLSMLSEKIQTIHSTPTPDLERLARHILSNAEVPPAFFTIVIEGKKAQQKASKY